MSQISRIRSESGAVRVLADHRRLLDAFGAVVVSEVK